MEFYTSNTKKRPIRLSESTRMFAWDSLNGKYGDDTFLNMAVDVSDTDHFNELTPLQKYDSIIQEICKKSPIRICENELISGAATYGAAIQHVIPAVYNSSYVFSSISHTTLNFKKVLDIGINGIEKELDEIMVTDGTSPFRESLKNTIHSLKIWHARYLENSHGSIKENLSVVPFNPPNHFYEAVQSLWLVFAFTRLCGNWPGIGRIDEMLGEFLEKDLKENKITIDEAREILSHFFIKGCEWIQSNTPKGSGDAQHYQNIILSGVDKNGVDVTNTVSFLVLDIVEELGISDFPITVRVNENTDDDFLRRCSDVVSHGGGVIAFYNEPLVLSALESLGYPKDDFMNFTNDGCWEVLIPGNTNFSYIPFDCLQILLNDTLGLNKDIIQYENMQQLYQAFKTHLSNHIEKIYKDVCTSLLVKENDQYRYLEGTPCSVVSLFIDNSAMYNASYSSGGTKYVVRSPHIGGAPDVGNSLYAIKKLVFDDKKVSFLDFMDILKNNWSNNEILRQYAMNKYCYYGNDNDESDAFTVQVLNDFAEIVNPLNNRCPIIFPAGVSTFGRQIEWAKYRIATPFGAKKNAVLSGNASPTPSTNLSGATSIIKSYCKANLVKQQCGAALDIHLHNSAINTDNGVASLCQLIRGFVELGGFFMQIDILDTKILKDAQENPEVYKTLSVRVSGWNARFVTLNKEWQDMIINNNITQL